jgi:5'-3' exonuclease
MKELYKNILESVETERTQNIDKHKNSRVLIIDGLNTFIRCWSSIPTMNDNGEHVGGATGVLKSIGFAIRTIQPTRVVVVFDGKGGSNTRKKKFGGYKAQRDSNKLRVNRQYADMMNDEDERESMKRQYTWLMELLHGLPLTTMIYDGVEADDIMAYIPTQILKEGEQAVLMSTDKDFLQLVDDNTIVWSPTKKKIYNKKVVKEEFGIESKNLLLYRVLDGDKSDNIPGVYGCGIKTVIKRFPELTEDTKLSVDDLLTLSEQKKEETKGKIKLYNDILEAKKQILLNRELMQLDDVDISGIIKMQCLDRFNEPVKPLNKMDFMKILLKYKVVNNFGDINDWLKTTFGNLIID